MAVLHSGEAPLFVFVSSRISPQTLWAREAVAEVLQQPDWLYLTQAAYAAIQHPGTIILPDVLRDDSAA